MARPDNPMIMAAWEPVRDNSWDDNNPAWEPEYSERLGRISRTPDNMGSPEEPFDLSRYANTVLKQIGGVIR